MLWATTSIGVPVTGWPEESLSVASQAPKSWPSFSMEALG